MEIKDFTQHLWSIKDKLFRFAYRIVGQDAEDVVQDVYTKMWNKREERQHIENLEAFCIQMTKNLSLDRVRAKQRKGKWIDGNAEVTERQVVQENLAKSIEQQDAMSRIEKVVEQLPEKQKMVFHLRDVEGMSYKEIAQELEITVDQVKVNIFRARRQIRDYLTKQENYGLRENKRATR